MFRLTRAIVLTLLAVTVIGGLGYGIYQAGFDQGLVSAGSDLIENQRAVGPFITGGIAFMFKALFAFLFLGFIAKLFMFRRHGHPARWQHAGGDHGHADWRGPADRRGRREEMRARMEEKLTDWHEKAHAEAGDVDAGGEPTDA